MLTQLIVINSLICIGFYKACRFSEADSYDAIGLEGRRIWEGMPDKSGRMFLWWVRYYIGKVVSDFWAKPIYSCPPCMASLHTILPFTGYAIWLGISPVTALVVWPFYALAVSGLNTLIIHTIEI